MNKREDLEKAIINLESQRALLGDATVDAAIAGINIQLADLAPLPRIKQRKLITVLFSDLSGFTAMSENMDPEEISDLMSIYFDAVTPSITRYGGVIEKFIGDAIMAVFGLPQVHENDPENAIRAALEMKQALSQVNIQLEKRVGFCLQMRIGINTGIVFATTLSGEERDFTVVGDTVNIASRLESAAPLNGILISYDTYRHVRDMFDVVPRDLLTVKGKSKPLQTYLVEQSRPHAFYPHARGVDGVNIRMVGRDKEIQALQNIWKAAVATRKTTLTTIVGDAGIGKSRLLYEFEQWLGSQPKLFTLFRGRSVKQTQGVPYFLLRDILADHFDIRESDPIADVRQKIEAGIAEVLGNNAMVKAHILGQWLGYDFSDSHHIIAIGKDAEQLRNRGVLYLSQFWVELAGKRPLTIFLEDIHWADTSSLDALLDILRQEPSLALIIMVITRPSLFECRPSWPKLGQIKQNKTTNFQFKVPEHHLITLHPLPVTADQELLAEILQKVDTLPKQLFDLVTGRAEGNPFYMEELVKMLIDNNVILTGDKTWQVDTSQLIKDQIPSTLTGVLQARLDNLIPDAKVTLQRASVIGRIFWDAAIKELGDDPNQVQLRPLLTRELIYQQQETAFIGTDEYLFKHDLLRDVTYQTVLKKTRLLYHKQIADWLVTVTEKSGRDNEYTAVIGEHYHAAGQIDMAAIWYGRAGKQAVSNFAHNEAIRYLSLALKFTLQNDYATRFSLLDAREQTYSMMGNREALIQDIEQLVTLASYLDPTQQAIAVLRQAQQAYYTADYIQTINYAQRSIEIGQRASETAIVSAGYRMWGWAAFRQGSYSDAQEFLQMGLELASNQKQVAECLHGLGLVANNQREYTDAKAYHEQSLLIRRKRGDRWGEAICLSDLGFMFWNQGRYAAARKHHEQSLAIRRELGYRFGEGESLFNLGSVASSENEYSSAKTHLECSLTIFHEVGNQLVKGLALHELGALAFAQNNFQLAERYYQQALVIRQKLNLTRYLVEDWAGMAQLKLAQGNPKHARRYGEKILDYLQENPRLHGSENPMRTFHFAWKSQIALEKSIEADTVLTLAAQVMQDYLGKNSDPGGREVYLSQPHHQVLWAAWIEKEKE